MKPRTLSLVSVPITVFAAIFAATNFVVAQRVRQKIADVTERRTRVVAELRRLGERPPPPARAKSPPRVGAEGSDRPAKTPAKRTPPPDASTLMARNPALRDLFQQYAQADLGFRYRPFYRAAKLSPETIARFQALMIEQEQQRMDLESAAAAAGVWAADTARLREEQEQRQQAEQRQLLGDDVQAKYRDFTRVEPLEFAVASVATLSAESGEPLTEAQGEQLLTMLARSSAAYRNGGKADFSTIDVHELLTEAQGVLTPNQFAALKGRADLAQAFNLARDYQIAHHLE